MIHQELIKFKLLKLPKANHLLINLIKIINIFRKIMIICYLNYCILKIGQILIDHHDLQLQQIIMKITMSIDHLVAIKVILNSFLL